MQKCLAVRTGEEWRAVWNGQYAQRVAQALVWKDRAIATRSCLVVRVVCCTTLRVVVTDRTTRLDMRDAGDLLQPGILQTTLTIESVSACTEGKDAEETQIHESFCDQADEDTIVALLRYKTHYTFQSWPEARVIVFLVNILNSKVSVSLAGAAATSWAAAVGG